jgi:hypothetical protein
MESDPIDPIDRNENASGGAEMMGVVGRDGLMFSLCALVNASPSRADYGHARI